MAKKQERFRERSLAPRTSKPILIARARIGNAWHTLGAGWKRRNDKPGYSVKLNTLPVGDWDGSFLLIPLIGDEVTEEPLK